MPPSDGGGLTRRSVSQLTELSWHHVVESPVMTPEYLAARDGQSRCFPAKLKKR